MSLTEDELHRRKVIKWLAIGSAIVLGIIGLMLLIGAWGDEKAAEAEKASVSDSDRAAAEVFAKQFITDAGTFGVSKISIENNSFDFLKGLLASKLGSYKNDSLGYSRGERYESLIPLLDPNGEEDTTDYYAKKLDAYYPDWSGQLLSYSASDVLLTPGEPYFEGETVLLPFQASFTSNVSLFSEENVTGAQGTWKEYSGSEFQTVNLVLSQQASGIWRVWSIDDPQTSPYVLSTWKNPDWKTSAPNKATLLPTQ